MRPMQPGDVKSTFADITKLNEWVNYHPSTSFDEGIHLFANWYKDYFNSDYYRPPLEKHTYNLKLILLSSKAYFLIKLLSIQ